VQFIEKVVWNCYGILAILKTIYLNVVANKKSHSCWLFGFVGAKNSIIKSSNYRKKFLLFLALTKAMQTLPIYAVL
jgi:hypothetical protein